MDDQLVRPLGVANQERWLFEKRLCFGFVTVPSWFLSLWRILFALRMVFELCEFVG